MSNASIPRRGVALLLDSVFIMAFAFILGAMIPLWRYYPTPVIGAASTYLIPLIAPLYFIVLEGMKGATPGKTALGIKVVTSENENIGYKESFIRNILRPIDAFPAFWLVGIVSILITEEDQRVGDIAAGTKVVDQ